MKVVRPLRLIRFAAVALLLPGSALQAASPFEPAGTPVVSVQGDPELQALQFSGISVIGSDHRFNLTNSRTHKSFWVALNESFDGFTVTSYDPASDSVIVQRGAFSRVVPLRRATIVAQAVPAPVVPVPLPPAGAEPARTVVGVNEIANPKTPKEIAQAEFEARMLVSDLMEISMRERARQKALRDAQRAPQNAPPPPVVTPIAPR